MTTQELHINLELLLQKVNSHWNQNFLIQERDTFINREILKFVKQRINPLSNGKRQSVFDILKRTQDLNTLIKTIPLDVVELNKKEDIVYLPFNHLYYISSVAEVTPNCSKTINPQIDKITYVKSFKEIIIVNSLTTLVITINGNVVFNLTELPSGYLPNDSIDDYKKKFIINNAILLKLRKTLPLIEVEFDKSNHNFVLRSKVDFTISVVENTVDKTITQSQSSFKGNSNTKVLDARIRIVDEEFKDEILSSNLSKPKDESIIGYLRNNALILPKHANSVYNSINLTYFCLPSKVDLLLDYNSELPDIVLEEVISNVAQTLKGVISSDTYEKYSQENLLIE